jgi:predicted nucleic acid-binding protein
MAAKKHGFVSEVLPVIKRLAEVGYRMSADLISEIARLAGEDES